MTVRGGVNPHGQPDRNKTVFLRLPLQHFVSWVFFQDIRNYLIAWQDTVRKRFDPPTLISCLTLQSVGLVEQDPRAHKRRIR